VEDRCQRASEEVGIKIQLTSNRKQQGLKMKNLGMIERVLRVLVGGALAVCALMFLLSEGRLIWQLAYAALIALGADFVVTGIRGYCPLYNRLGWSTAEPKAHG